MSKARGSNGDSGLVGSLVVLLVLAALAQWLLDIDLLRYAETAVDWLVDMFNQMAAFFERPRQ